MRLTEYQHSSIINLAVKFFGADSKVWLFGSRVDDNQRGGDIDLLIETQMTDIAQICRAEIDFLTGLQNLLGEQKIDLLIDYPNKATQPAIFAIARQQGLCL